MTNYQFREIQTNALSGFPSHTDGTRFYSLSTSITLNGITAPQYSKCIFINQPGSLDAIMVCFGYDTYVYVFYRNNGKWNNSRKI